MRADIEHVPALQNQHQVYLCAVAELRSRDWMPPSVPRPRPHATAGSLENMVRLDAARFYMGSESPEALPTDREGPARQVTLGACYISKFAVTNRQFAEFVRAVGYRTEAERFGWSFVFHNHVPEPIRGPTMPGAPWWLRIDRADWAHPEGPDSSVLARRDHPVVQVSWNDALAYCAWAATGCRPKPSENTPHAAVLTRIPTPKATN